jgi:multiple antibiotic resistance protein
MDIKALVTLLAIVNPLAAIPFFIHYTQGFTREQRRRTIRVASFSSFAVIAISALLGLKLLEFFGISLASFQVGGGMLLLTSSLAMLNAQPAEAKSAQVEMKDKDSRYAEMSADTPRDTPRDAPRDIDALSSARASIAVVPLTIPLLTGPATMSTVVIYAEKAKTFWQLGTLVGYGVVIGLATFACFSLAGPIARFLGQTGINVMTRLMGLILAALAVEVMADGLVKLFPALAS